MVGIPGRANLMRNLKSQIFFFAGLETANLETKSFGASCWNGAGLARGAT
jgi:hypothetical protein